MSLKIVNRERYELLEKMAQRQDNYIEQIRLLDKKVQENNDKQAFILGELDKINSELKLKEESSKKLASKLGGVKKSLNHQKEKNKILLELVNNKDKELVDANKKLELMQKLKRVPNLEDLKDYFENRKECERRHSKWKTNNLD